MNSFVYYRSNLIYTYCTSIPSKKIIRNNALISNSLPTLKYETFFWHSKRLFTAKEPNDAGNKPVLMTKEMSDRSIRLNLAVGFPYMI